MENIIKQTKDRIGLAADEAQRWFLSAIDGVCIWERFHQTFPFIVCAIATKT
jgi:hypothetical protein